MLTWTEYDAILKHPNTTRADAMYAYSQGVEENPYEEGNPKRVYWDEGIAMAKESRHMNELRARNAKANQIRTDRQ